MTYFRSEQKRSRLRREILAAFCVNRSGRIKEKALHIADIQGFLLSIEVSFWPLWSGKRDSHSRCARMRSRERLLTPPAPGRGALRSRGTGPPLKTQSNRENRFWFSLLLWSGKRDSDPRPQPWQGCALPTELFPHDVSLNASAKVAKISESPNFSRPKPHFFVFSQDLPLCLPILYLPRGWQQRLARAFVRSPAGFPVPAAGTVRYQPLRHRQAPRRRPRSDTSFVFLHGILLEILSL